MNFAVIAFTRNGCEIAKKVKAALLTEDDQCRLFTLAKLGMAEFEPYQAPLSEFVRPLFQWADALVFVSSTGIAVRGIANWVKSKTEDPAVIVIDETAKFVISLLSGHIGQANELTNFLAEKLGSIAVVTTATDVNKKFAVDAWAAKNGLFISNMKTAKKVSSAILESNIPLYSDFPIMSELPSGTCSGTDGELGIYIGYKTMEPFQETLTLVPRVLNIGIGCRKGTTADAIEAVVSQILLENGIYPQAISSAASIDLKQNEAGLLEFCRNRNLPIKFYTGAQLQNVQGEFTKSEFVRSITGVDNVCERAAALDAEKVIVKKTAYNGVTVALAQKRWEVKF